MAPGRYWQERWDAAGAPDRTMHFFDLGEDVIWGATAWMLYLFLFRLLGGRRDQAAGLTANIRLAHKHGARDGEAARG